MLAAGSLTPGKIRILSFFCAVSFIVNLSPQVPGVHLPYSDQEGVQQQAGQLQWSSTAGIYNNTSGPKQDDHHEQDSQHLIQVRSSRLLYILIKNCLLLSLRNFRVEYLYKSDCPDGADGPIACGLVSFEAPYRPL